MTAANTPVSREALASVFTTEPFNSELDLSLPMEVALNNVSFAQMQSEMLSKLEHEPLVVDLFQKLMGKHYENLKSSSWNDKLNYIISVDFPTAVLLTLLEFMRGYSTQEWEQSLKNMQQRIPLNVVLPQFMLPLQNCTYYTFLRIWYVFTAWRIAGPYKGGTSKVAVQQALAKLFADLQMFEPWTRGNQFEYHGLDFSSSTPDLQLKFTTPRFDAFAFDFESMEIARQTHTLKFADLNYMRDLVVRFTDDLYGADAIYKITRLSLEGMRERGVDLELSAHAPFVRVGLADS